MTTRMSSFLSRPGATPRRIVVTPRGAAKGAEHAAAGCGPGRCSRRHGRGSPARLALSPVPPRRIYRAMSLPRGGTLRRPARVLPPTALLLLLVAAPLSAQRRYLIEAGAAGAFPSFDNATDLGTGPGGLFRLGVWLPLRLSLEGEGSIVRPKTKSAQVGVSVKTFGGALLYNVPLGSASSAYGKIGIASTTYGGSCPAVAPSPPVICGTAAAFIGGAGFRIALTPTVMIRGEGVINRNSSSSLRFSNFGANLGLSLMLASQPALDTDHDGVPDKRDRCPNTPPGVQVDPRGCPVDSDADGVPDGIDKCPGTAKGVEVDATGCPIDSDGDGVPDGLDKCPDTPAGAAVDASGCPVDSDGDGVLDGIDQCPNTPPGAPVNAFGCAAGETGTPPPRPRPGQPAQPPPAAPPAPAPTPAPGPAGRRALVLRENAF